MSLDSLEFSDLYLGKDRAHIRGPKLSPNPQDIEFELVSKLRIQCDQAFASKETSGTDFWVMHEGTTYRGSLLNSVSGDFYVLRRQPKEVKRVSDLIPTKAYTDRLLDPDLKGLILIAGEFGHGKTWTASGIVIERLEKYGGVATAFEDPPELPMQGKHGNGICFQSHVDKNGFGTAIHSAARWAPDILYFSELRDADSANEALKSALNGKIAVCTIHGNSPISAIERLFNLATSGTGAITNQDDVASLIANGLAIVLHQKLERDGDHVTPKIQWLSVNTKSSVKSVIKERKWSNLLQEINQQHNEIRFSRS